MLSHLIDIKKALFLDEFEHFNFDGPYRMSFNLLTVEDELIRRLNSHSVGYNNFFIYEYFISPFLIYLN